jgi:thymidylate synthase (FAD)
LAEMSVELLDFMGTDLTVVNAARVSFSKHHDEFQEKDVGLISFLARENHFTPFCHCTLTFRITAPIFVARQLGKHQVGLVWNEVSRRYVDSEPEFYVPETWRKRAENVKQGSSDETVDILRNLGFKSQTVDEAVSRLNGHAFALYEDMIDAGVCPEQARMVLPQSMMTEWYWTGSLMAFIRVLKLRLDPHTQYETRIVAEKMAPLIEEIFPVSYKALMEASV